MDKTVIIGLLLIVIGIISGAYKHKKEVQQLNRKYEVICGSLNDCCRNMIDVYDLPDSIYNYYLDIIEEEGFDKNEVKHSYFIY